MVESRPPLRNAPSGTSLINRRSTARVSRLRTVSPASRSLTVGEPPDAAWRSRSRQYTVRSIRPSASTVRTVAGSTCLTFRYKVRGHGT